MVAIIYKWLIVFALSFYSKASHPIFLSVTEIGYNAAEGTLEVSCKIFTDDFETALRKLYNTKVDLLDTRFRTSMNVLVNDYIQKHLSVKINGKTGTLNFIGFEQQDEGIQSYYEIRDVGAFEKLEVKNNILYEFKDQQMGIIHVTGKGKRQSTRLNNPDSNAVFVF